MLQPGTIAVSALATLTLSTLTLCAARPRPDGHTRTQAAAPQALGLADFAAACVCVAGMVDRSEQGGDGMVARPTAFTPCGLPAPFS